MLSREILVAEPFRWKAGTREKGQWWEKIACALNEIQVITFQVDQRGVRDRYGKLEKQFKKKMAQEERPSGIAPEFTELDEAIETIAEKIENVRDELLKWEECRKNNVEKERETAECR